MSSHSPSPRSFRDPASRMTRSLLGLGVVAGPLFAIVALTQAFTREGFDLTVQPLSLLSTGDLGWLQIANFIVTGLLFLAAAWAMRSTFTEGRRERWVPRLLGVFGAGMVAAGIFVPDPAFGFPTGTPDGAPNSTTWHSALHYTFASIAFVALIIACFLVARRFAGLHERGWVIATRIVGVLLVTAVATNFSGSTVSAVRILFACAGLVGFVWVSALSAWLWAGYSAGAVDPGIQRADSGDASALLGRH